MIRSVTTRASGVVGHGRRIGGTGRSVVFAKAPARPNRGSSLPQPHSAVGGIVGQLVEQAVGSAEVLPSIAGLRVSLELTHKLDTGRPKLLTRRVDVLDQEPDHDLVLPELFGSSRSPWPKQLQGTSIWEAKRGEASVSPGRSKA